MIGQTISHYRILDKLGEGGMGVVYRAQDITLDRTVALKFLPPHLSSSEGDKARFVQEAKAASAINHPNICTIYSIEEHDGQLFIAMEYVDGQTLREKKGTFGFKQAIDTGIQIADGLAAAHEKGIVHRDIKPENIMIRKDGIAQIMDFGLAKLRASGSAITRLTKEGSTVGTAGYMSPEQVQGHDADHRSDIFSYGVLLYELLTGQLPFKGVHETALAYEIVNVDAAPMSAIKPDLDPNLDAIVLECLEKDPRERTQSMAQISLDLKRYRRESSRQRASRITAARPAFVQSGTMAIPSVEPAAGVPAPRASRWPWVVAAFFFFVAAGTMAVHLMNQPTPAARRVTRSALLPPTRVNFNVQVGGHLAVSPDGQKIAFVGTDTNGTDLIWVRPIESLTPIPLAGTNGATYPFWSPDGKSLGYFAEGKLKKIDANGGPTLTICEAPEGRGGSWSQAGVIVFAPSAAEGLSVVSAAGGRPSAATKFDTVGNVRNHRWPHFLPDGKHFIYTTQSASVGLENDVVRIAAVDGSVDSVLLHGNSNVEYASGYLLFHRQATLMAQPFDTATFRLAGDAVPIAEQLQYNEARSRSPFSVSRNGVLVYQGGEEQQGKYALFDQAGNRLTLLAMKYPRGGKLSHDGKKIAYVYFENQSRQADIWLYEMDGGRSSRFTFEPSLENTPFWSPLDDSVVYSSNRKNRFDLYMKSANGTGNEELLVASDLDKFVSDWSLDGNYLAYTSTAHPKTKADLWLLPLKGDRKPVAFLQTEFREGGATFSPDAKWIAYNSDESGRFEVYVRALDGSAGKWQISINGGTNCRWSRDGKNIFFQSLDRREMSAAVRVLQSSIVVDSVRTLFDLESRGILGNISDVGADKQKFLAVVTDQRQATSPITLVVNWDEELKRK